MKLSFHGQSTIYFESNDKKVIVDPFISGNDKSDLDEQTLDVDYIILTHGHGDHFGDVVELANRNHATVIGSAEVQGYLTTYHGIEHAHGMNYDQIIVRGNPKDELVKHANSGKYDIVVLSNRKAEQQKKFVLGSVSHKVAKRATIPVLIVK